MSRLVVFLILLSVLSSCGFFRSAERERCKRLLSREKFSEILLDLYLTEGLISEKQSQIVEPVDSVEYYIDGVFEKHGVSFETFNEALACYLLHQEEMEAIHEQVLNSLAIMKSDIEATTERLQRARTYPTGMIWALPEEAQADTDTIPAFSAQGLLPRNDE